jgi:indolepyruvate ferredoxin oxidoreductase alpha subunit
MGKENNLKLLTGNEAIARGAYEAGVKVATAYPGTPSTEILENISKYPEIYSQWSVNEKVALEVASGASIAGGRTITAMKHVGLNVAADPFMTLAYTGVGGGMVIISADDPHMHSSQNEQDNRFYAKFARVPMLEPSDSREALELVKEAFEISERFDTPVILRTTTRISHSRSLVTVAERAPAAEKKYSKNAQKYVMIPAYARLRHDALLERWLALKDFCEDGRFHEIYLPQGKKAVKDIGIITSGVSFQYCREVFTEVPILKLKMTGPLPEKTIRQFCAGKKLLIVVEELEPYIEEQVRLLNTGAQIAGKQYFPYKGEFGLEILQKVHDSLFGTSLFEGKAQSNLTSQSIKDIPARPPVLCAGCPHRPVFHVLKKLKTVVMGDIGCYTLSVLPPLSALDSCLCMGAGIGQALGMEKADPDLKNRVVSVIGDSTFFHSGITPLVDNAYNGGTGLIIILDNSTTAMTGHQAHPGVGMTLMGSITEKVKPEDFARAAGTKNIKVVDPYNRSELETVLKEELERKELSVVVCRRICVLLEKKKGQSNIYIDEAECSKCGNCVKFGCPAIELRQEKYEINASLCTECQSCVPVCKSKAIKIKQ